jgi:Flp pilus assembly protein TadG
MDHTWARHRASPRGASLQACIATGKAKAEKVFASARQATRQPLKRQTGGPVVGTSRVRVGEGASPGRVRYRIAAGFGQTCTPLVPDVMLNLFVVLYQPPTKMALLNGDVSPFTGSPVVSQ